jgi:hypothetical protein
MVHREISNGMMILVICRLYHPLMIPDFKNDLTGNTRSYLKLKATKILTFWLAKFYKYRYSNVDLQNKFK